MTKLTGYQRFVIVQHWLKSDRELTKEQYIKKVCQLKGIEYTPATKRDRPLVKIITPQRKEANEQETTQR